MCVGGSYGDGGAGGDVVEAEEEEGGGGCRGGGGGGVDAGGAFASWGVAAVECGGEGGNDKDVRRAVAPPVAGTFTPCMALGGVPREEGADTFGVMTPHEPRTTVRDFSSLAL